MWILVHNCLATSSQDATLVYHRCKYHALGQSWACTQRKQLAHLGVCQFNYLCTYLTSYAPKITK